MTLLHQLVGRRNQSQIHTAGAVSIALVLVLLIVVAVPAWSHRTHRLELRTAVQAAEARLQRTRSQMEQSRREAAALVAKVAAADAASPVSDTLDQRLLDISSVATKLGLQIDSVEPGSPTKRPDGDVVTTVAATGHGTYSRTVAFIQQLRADAPDLTIETIQLNAAMERGCSFRVSLNWWSPPATAARPMTLAGGER